MDHLRIDWSDQSSSWDYASAPEHHEAAADLPEVRAALGSAPATALNLMPLTGWEELDLARSLAIGAHRRLLDLLHAKREANTGLFRSGNSFCEKSVLFDAGIPFETYVSDGSLRDLMAKFAPLLPLLDHHDPRRAKGLSSPFQLSRLARKMMDEMEANGTPVPRRSASGDQISLSGVAELWGWDHYLLKNSAPIKAELKRRVRAGQLKMGERYFGKPRTSQAERRRYYNAIAAVLRGYRDANRPIPAHPERPNGFYWEKIFDEAGITDPIARDDMRSAAEVRLEMTRTVNLVGFMTEAEASARADVLTYGGIIERADGLLRQEYRAANPAMGANSIQEDRYAANEISHLRRMKRANGRALDDDVLIDLNNPAARDAGLTESVKGNLNYRKSLTAWLDRGQQLTRAATYPATFSGAFSAALAVSGISAASLSEATGAPEALIADLRKGRIVPSYRNEHFVPLFEQKLGLPAGTLTSRMPETRNGKNTTGRATMVLSDGRKVKLGKYWRFLPKGAYAWSTERLQAAVEDADRRHFPKSGAHYVRTQAVLRNLFRLPPQDISCPIYREFEDCREFKLNLVDDDRTSKPGHQWSDATADMMRARLVGFERWLRLPVAMGGCGLQPHQVSLTLVLNHRLVAKHIAWRITRAAHLLDESGIPIGPRITATERDFVLMFAGMLDRDYGWMTQSQSVLAPPTAILDKVRVPKVLVNSDRLEFVDDASCRESEILPQEVLDRDWKDACALSRKFLLVLSAHLDAHYKLMRDPNEPIYPILKHEQPIAVVVRMVLEALKRARPLETAPVYHALDFQRAVAMLLLMTVVFRSKTLRNLTYRADGTGQLRRGADGYDFTVAAEHFKNCASLWLFGPSYRRRDYERSLQDWGGLTGILDHYITKCRPILLAGRESDLLFPPPNGRGDWDATNFNHLIKNFTREFAVYNIRTGTGMDGVKPFGPHPARNVVATHILKNCPEEVRWVWAAYVLNTSVEKVRDNYGWLSVSEELGKTDPMMSKAFELAASEVPLW